MGMFTDFLNSLSPIFSQDPQAYDALSIASDCYVTVANDTLTIYQSNQESSYALGNYTLSSLVNALNSAGLVATLVSTGDGTVSARALLDIQAQATTSVSLTLTGFSSNNYLLFKSQAAMLDTALQTVQANSVMFNLRAATGVWLDYWGWFLQVTRYDNEPDSLYAERMIGVRLGHNVNNIAMQNFFSKMGYTTQVTDGNPGSFTVTVTLPKEPPGSFYYSTAQLADAVTVLKASGTQAMIVLEGQLTDTIVISDSVSSTTNSAAWTWGNFVWGQFNWNANTTQSIAMMMPSPTRS